MKSIYAIIVLFVAFTFAGAQTKQKETVKQTDSKFETTVVRVPTVVCKSCADRITKAVKKIPGVKSAKVDVKEKTATVTYASSKTNLSKIELAIANAGYDANETKRDSKAFEKLDECCKIDAKKDDKKEDKKE